ncbi:hypothetical protein CPB86DRAFT_816111 [Serendipita vermifera]|nr:hypothetical protein CPB86DRAFT_816111 [Serendipita vermifera]
MTLIQVVANNRLGGKVKVWVDSEDTVEVLKKMIAAQMGTDWQKIVLKVGQPSKIKSHLVTTKFIMALV